MSVKAFAATVGIMVGMVTAAYYLTWPEYVTLCAAFGIGYYIVLRLAIHRAKK